MLQTKSTKSSGGSWVGCRTCSTKKGLACRSLTREPSVFGLTAYLQFRSLGRSRPDADSKTPKQEARLSNSNAKNRHHRRKGSAPGCCNCQSGNIQPNKRRAPRVAGAGCEYTVSYVVPARDQRPNVFAVTRGTFRDDMPVAAPCRS